MDWAGLVLVGLFNLLVQLLADLAQVLLYRQPILGSLAALVLVLGAIAWARRHVN